MSNFKRAEITSLFIAAALAAAGDPAAAAPSRLRCEYAFAPNGVDTPAPRLSWELAEGCQAAYQVQVTRRDHQPVWDSGRVASDRSVGVEYAGTTLESSEAYHWRVRVWSMGTTEPTPWSAEAGWTTGPFAPGNWTARWISTETDALAPEDCPYVFHDFTLERTPELALLHLNVMGYVEATLNGRPVSDQVLSPAVSDYRTRSLYLTFPVQDFLRAGTNRLVLHVSRGWHLKPHYGAQINSALLRVQLDLRFGDGSRQRVASDGDWLCLPSARRMLGSWKWSNHGGERVDNRVDESFLQERDLGKMPSGLRHVHLAERPPAGPAVWDRTPPIRLVKTIPAVSILPTDAPEAPPINTTSNVSEIGLSQIFPRVGVRPTGPCFLIDLGTELAGYAELRFTGLAPGQEIEMEYADRLDVLQVFGQRDLLIASGRPGETFRSKFNYHGFRWILVHAVGGKPLTRGNILGAQALATAHDYERMGTFACGSERVTRMHAVNLWTLNCLSVGGYLSDCPHRERWGYGDGQALYESLAMNYNAANFYAKWTTDWSDFPTGSGYLAHVAPQIGEGGGGPAWGGGMSAMTWRNAVYYGDLRTVRANERKSQRYLDALRRYEKDGVLRRFGTDEWQFIGDWIAPGRGMDTTNWPSVASAECFNNCYRIYLTGLVADMADALGKTSEATALRRERDAARPKIHQAFYNPAKRFYVIDEQAYQAMPLMAGIVPETLRASVIQQLEKEIRVNCQGHLDSGMLGTYFLFDTLTRRGRGDLVWEMVRQETYPGWGYMLKQGATTWWEQWNGYYSRIHSTLCFLDGWFYQGLAGIRPGAGADGFRRFTLAPTVVDGVPFVEATYHSLYGLIRSRWERRGETVDFTFEVPPNTAADICLPGVPTVRKHVGPGSYHWQLKAIGF